MRRLISRKAILHDVANLLYVVGDVREGSYSAHSLHQTFDVCAPGNIERAERMLDLAISEVESMTEGEKEGRYTASFERVGCHLGRGGCHAGLFGKRRRYVARLMHDYLVAFVLTDWLTIAFPPGAALVYPDGASKSVRDNVIDIWKEKKAETRIALVNALHGNSRSFARRIPPI